MSNGVLPIRVLLAEDEPALQAALRDLIDADDGLEVVGVADDAEAAISKAEQLQPDVALLDVRMPKGGGPVAARGIAGVAPGTRVLALSAYEDQPTVVEMLRAGAVGYLVKGGRPEEILDAIRRAMRGQGSLSVAVLADVIGELVDDIAERLERERVLMQSERKFRDLLAAAPDGVVMINSDGRIVLVNGEAERMFGYAVADLMGRRIDLLLPERHRTAHVDHWAEYLADPRTRPMGIGLELAGRRKDGTEFPVDISLSSFETDDGRLATAFIRDMTARRAAMELERALVERQPVLAHLVSAGEEERQRIASDIHDDSIQAITAAGMRLQLLRRGLSDPVQLGLLDELESTIELSVERLRHLLFELRPPALDREGLSAALRAYLDQARQQAPLLYTVDDRLTTQPTPEIRLILYRIAQEALTNVREHSRAQNVRVTLERRPDGYFVRIADDGVGFSGSEDATAPGHIGLVAMRERAELAGGWLRIESEEGVGTTVEFQIPLDAQSAPSAPAAP
jgi:PAS domain S-box-containing protein